MRLDWELARRGYRRYAAYPAATWAGLFTNVFFGFLFAYIMVAVFERRADIGGYDVGDALAYVWLSQALISVVAIFGPSWQELALRVRSGDVATDLQRPVDLQRALLAQDAGRAAYQAIYRAVPQFVLGALVFDVTLPGDPLRLLAVGVSIALAVLVSFGIRFLVNLTSFWLLDYRGVYILALVTTQVLAGMIVPLSFYPHGIGDALRALPFASMLQAPIDIYVGEPLGGSTVFVLCLQAAWALALFGAGRMVLSAGTRKLVVQGG